MTRIAVIGGTGYAGRNIVAEAVSRGHTVVSVARNVPAERVEGATYLEGNILDVPSLVSELEGVEVVVSTVPARGDMVGNVRPSTAELVAALPENVRVGVIGGAGGSLIAEGGPRLVDQDSFTEEYKPEALEAIGILEDLQATDASRDWFYVHPAGGFGVYNPGERTGSYRIGGDVLVTDDEGNSYISGQDLAVAIVDEIESPKYSRARFTVGY
ncbi:MULTISPECIES: NAD(P)H-binding protein [unclassified Microbacterium]|uniref:NAD(P)-dependent oxidoreductase n=1 Tax=unclassified Microbacterium TaxID=2609290 RepID=UPI00214B6988|nr:MULTISPECIES: NAD(P)H-binding protein [unclassified Microbacterium]MCR2810730.1 NAD(P)H-binding protein [Microbacterium sp. zg.B185]WIM18266.1 NAD(P)H-binding protein [Microbacterium sp. zg-B185]